jgi:DNA replication ATP-dependent helicase Dna2
LENGSRESSGLSDWFDEMTVHIQDEDKIFFSHWDTLLTKEEQDMYRFRKELWTMTSEERERVGR